MRTAKVELRKCCCNRLCKNPKLIVKFTVNYEVMVYMTIITCAETSMADHGFWHSWWGTNPVVTQPDYGNMLNADMCLRWRARTLLSSGDWYNGSGGIVVGCSPGFDSRSGYQGFVRDKVALGQVFSEYFDFPCQFSFRQMLHTDLSSGAGTISPLVAGLPSGLSLTSPQELKRTRRSGKN
jgi:hypothetical protein